MRAAIILGQQPRYIKVQEAVELIKRQFEIVKPEVAEILLVIGGDGTMIWAAREYNHIGIPFYGINRGTVGFLLNDHPNSDLNNLVDVVQDSIATKFPFLQAVITHLDRTTQEALAFNDVWTKAVNRRGQGAKHRLFINGQDLMQGHEHGFYSGDGIIVCTPGGSTAYNRAAGGVILDPEVSTSLGLTPICPYSPDNFRPQVLPGSSIVTIEILEDDKRQHLVTADNQVFDNVASATIRLSDQSVTLLFKQGTSYFDKTRRLRFPWQS
jgi:NAD+ kinase